jgi:hypothetical protein
MLELRWNCFYGGHQTWAHFCMHPKFQYLYLLQRRESIKFAFWGGGGAAGTINFGRQILRNQLWQKAPESTRKAVPGVYLLLYV